MNKITMFLIVLYKYEYCELDCIVFNFKWSLMIFVSSFERIMVFWAFTNSVNIICTHYILILNEKSECMHSLIMNLNLELIKFIREKVNTIFKFKLFMNSWIIQYIQLGLLIWWFNLNVQIITRRATMSLVCYH